MKYLGIARVKNNMVEMPDTYNSQNIGEYEVMEMGGDILLIPSALQHERLKLIKRLTKITLEEHRESLEGLAK